MIDDLTLKYFGSSQQLRIALSDRGTTCEREKDRNIRAQRRVFSNRKFDLIEMLTIQKVKSINQMNVK